LSERNERHEFVKQCFRPLAWARGSCGHEGDAERDVPVVDKPIFSMAWEEAIASGCDEIIIVTAAAKS